MSGRLDPRLRPWPPGVLRDAVYDGLIVCFAPSPTSLALRQAAWAVVERHLGPEPREAQHRMPVAELLARLGQAREALAAAPLRALVRRWVEEAGLAPARIDRPRLRAVTSGGWRSPGAAPAWSRHRDTWYANPATQLNAWMPLHPVTPADSLQLWPQAFGRAVANDSERFVLGDFMARGGFGSTAPTPGVFPEATGPEAEAAGLGLTLPAGAVVVFSAAQLHGPPRQETGLTRFSVDFRIAPRGAGPGAPDPDNRSQGDASEGYDG